MKTESLLFLSFRKKWSETGARRGWVASQRAQRTTRWREVFGHRFASIPAIPARAGV